MIPSRQKRLSYKLQSLKNLALGRGVGSSSDVRVVRMPRGEYLKHFARDRYNVYIGTEKERIWTDEELELRFGRYRSTDELRLAAGRQEEVAEWESI